MAKEPATTSPEDVFIREVDEEYRRDQLASFWTRYGRWMVMAVGLGLVLLAAFLWWREQQAAALGVVSEKYSAAQQGLAVGDPKAKAEVERFAAGDYGGYTTLARFTKAELAVENGDNKAAVAAYAAIAGDNDLPPPLRQLATVKSLRLQYDELPAATLIAQLKPLAQPGAPWFGVAGEMLALAYMKDGKSELAGPIFAAISKDETIAPTLRQRAQQMAASLGALAIPQVAEAAVAAAPRSEPAAAATAEPAAAADTEKN